MDLTEMGVCYLSMWAPIWLHDVGKSRGRWYLSPYNAGHAGFAQCRDCLKTLNPSKIETMFFILHVWPLRFSNKQVKAKVPEAIASRRLCLQLTCLLAFMAPLYMLDFVNILFFLALFYYTCAKTFQSCQTLCEPMDCSPPGSSVHGDSPGKYIRVGHHALLQGIFLTQGSNLISCIGRRVLYY